MCRQLKFLDWLININFKRFFMEGCVLFFILFIIVDDFDGVELRFQDCQRGKWYLEISDIHLGYQISEIIWTSISGTGGGYWMWILNK